MRKGLAQLMADGIADACNRASKGTHKDSNNNEGSLSSEPVRGPKATELDRFARINDSVFAQQCPLWLSWQPDILCTILPIPYR